MEALSNIQRIIDKNSNNIPEGDYLELCNSTKDIFMDKTTINHRIFSRHDNFPHQFDNFTGNTRYYFENIFSEINKDIEWNVLNVTRKELLKQITKCREVKRVTKKIKCQVVHSYNIIHTEDTHLATGCKSVTLSFSFKISTQVEKKSSLVTCGDANTKQSTSASGVCTPNRYDPNDNKLVLA